MRKKIMAMTMIMLTIGIIIGLSAYHFYLRYQINIDYIFSTKIPKFSSEEAAFIKQNICNIYNHIEQPESFYISNVIIKANEVSVVLSRLYTLQDGYGEDSDGIFLSYSHDSFIVLTFDKNGNLLSIYVPKS